MGVSEPPLRYAVLLSEPERPDPAKVAAALSAARNIPFQDAALAARKAWGIVADGIEEAPARALAAALERAGLGATALPENLIEELHEPALAASAELAPDALRLALKSGETAALPWASLVLIAAAGFNQTTTRVETTREGPSLTQKAARIGIMLTTGLNISLGGKEREAQKTRRGTELVLYLDLARRKPSRRVRIDAQDFNYACLDAAMRPDSMGNFRTLLRLLAERAPGALRGRGTRTFLEGSPLATMGYDSLADLDREDRWLLTLSALKDP